MLAARHDDDDDDDSISSIDFYNEIQFRLKLKNYNQKLVMLKITSNNNKHKNLE